MSRKKKLQKKIAVAVSVVNILNVGAPMVLPYVNMTRDLPARGGFMEPVQGGSRFAACGARSACEWMLQRTTRGRRTSASTVTAASIAALAAM